MMACSGVALAWFVDKFEFVIIELMDLFGEVVDEGIEGFKYFLPKPKEEFKIKV